MNLKPVNKEEIQGRAKAFFRSVSWKNTFVFFSFVLLASCLWALQYSRQKFDFEVPIRIQYDHIPPGVVLSGNPPHEITLYLQDKGSVYLGYLIKRNKRLQSIVIDLQSISPNKVTHLISQADLRDLIDEKIAATSQIKSFSPDRIEINYSPLAKKDLPIAINGKIFPASGYIFSDSIRIVPDQVVAYGSENALDTLLHILTAPMNYENIDKDLVISTDLQTPEEVRLSVDQVNLSVKVEEYTERTFELPVICSNLPANRRIHFFPSSVELTVRVGLSKYAQLSVSNFEISVNYDDLELRNTANYSLTLTRKPSWVESYRMAPDMIEFLIEQKND